MISHYWFFKYGFKFQDSVCNVCHAGTMLNVNASDITIITIKNVDYRRIIHNISKSEAINLLENSKVLIYIKTYCLNFQSIQGNFFVLLFLFCYI